MMMAEVVRNAVNQGLEHICLVVEHLEEAHCRVTVLVGWVAAVYVVPLVVTTRMVGEHKRWMQTM